MLQKTKNQNNMIEFIFFNVIIVVVIQRKDNMPVKTDIQTISGAKAIIETLKKNSVDTIFGYPGGVVLDLYDELYKQSDIKHILVRHEQYAVHAAEGYARESGKCGVVLVTSGPGSTNTITGIANAYSDGYPLIILAGQISKKDSGRNAYQEIDLCEVTKTCTKAAFRIEHASQIQDIINNAFKIAAEDKKGPVVIELVKDIFTEYTEPGANEFHESDYIEINKYNQTDIQRIYSRILNSERPVIVAGGGVNRADAQDEFEKFALRYDIPVVNSMMGAGAYNKNYKNYFGMIGVNGDKSANEILNQSDLIISFGCRFNDRITCMFDTGEIFSKLIQINTNKEHYSQDFIQGDINSILSDLNNIPNSNFSFSKWCNKAQELRNLNNTNIKISNMMHGFEVLQKVNEFTKSKNVIFTSDVGQHQVMAVKNLTLTPNRRIFVSGGYGTMGFGLPAAIGVAIANPDACVVCITGDGSIQMSLSELALCRDLGLNIKVVILDNGYLGMVRQLQEKNCAGRYSQTKLSAPDFVKIGQSYGLDALRVNSPNEVDKALECAFSKNNTFILDFVIESLEIV